MNGFETDAARAVTIRARTTSEMCPTSMPSGRTAPDGLGL